MRAHGPTAGSPLGAILLAAAASLSCQNANTMTAPTSSTAPPAAANVAGSWSGQFQANDSSCAGTTAIASFQQNGSVVTGTVRTSACGVAGFFRGSIQGSALLGRLEQTGCTGGAVSGSVGGSVIRLSIGDMTKPLVTGDTPQMFGGTVILSR